MSDNRQVWLEAQAAEQAYWQQTRGRDYEFLRITFEKAVALEFALRHAPELAEPRPAGSRAAFEMGIGPLRTGVISLLPHAEDWRLVGIDPLEPVEPKLGLLCGAMLSAIDKLDYSHIVAQGEQVPQPDASFDLVVCSNVLEHVESPEGIARELRRLVKPDGLALVSENCLSEVGYVRKRLKGRQPHPAHPHTFTMGRLRRLLERGGFEVTHQTPLRYELCARLIGRASRRAVLARPVA